MPFCSWNEENVCIPEARHAPSRRECALDLGFMFLNLNSCEVLRQLAHEYPPRIVVLGRIITQIDQGWLLLSSPDVCRKIVKFLFYPAEGSGTKTRKEQR